MLNADVYSCLFFNAKFVVWLLLLGTRPKLVLCMPWSLSGRQQLTSFLELQWQPNTLQLPCWVMKESLTGNQQVTKVA